MSAPILPLAAKTSPPSYFEQYYRSPTGTNPRTLRPFPVRQLSVEKAQAERVRTSRQCFGARTRIYIGVGFATIAVLVLIVLLVMFK